VRVGRVQSSANVLTSRVRARARFGLIDSKIRFAYRACVCTRRQREAASIFPRRNRTILYVYGSTRRPFKRAYKFEFRYVRDGLPSENIISRWTRSHAGKLIGSILEPLLFRHADTSVTFDVPLSYGNNTFATHSLYDVAYAQRTSWFIVRFLGRPSCF